MNKQITKRQHYVPRKYLRKWANSDLICMKREKEDCITVNIMNVAQERFFYRLPVLRFVELKFAIEYLEEHPDCLFDNLELYVSSVILGPILYSYEKGEYNEFDQVVDYLTQRNILTNADFVRHLKELKLVVLPSETLEQNEDFKEIEQDTIMTEERINCDVENSVWPYPECAYSNDLSFFETQDGFEKMTLYLIHQLFRTPKFLELSKDTKLKSAFGEDGCKRILKALRLPLVSCIHSHIVSWQKDFNLYLMDNSTNLEFITGDQPVVNLDSARPVTDFDIFFPISPTKALFFCKKTRFDTIYSWTQELTRERVNSLNIKICESSFKQIYASNERIIKERNYFSYGIID